MEILNNYKNYKQYLPEYSSWAEQQDLESAKRIEYLKRNPDKMNEDDIQRGKNLLHAIDVMDEYSQSNAEDTEVATQMAIGQVVGLTTMAGVALVTPLMFMKSFQKFLDKVSLKNKGLGMFLGAAPDRKSVV